jgi:hypothetical protein
MDLMMDKFEFAGFEPDRDLKRTISRTLDIILGSAPSDAEPVARLSRTREGFSGVLRLCSQQGTFLAEAVGRDPAETLARLKDRIFEQITRWRTIRSA